MSVLSLSSIKNNDLERKEVVIFFTVLLTLTLILTLTQLYFLEQGQSQGQGQEFCH